CGTEHGLTARRPNRGRSEAALPVGRIHPGAADDERVRVCGLRRGLMSHHRPKLEDMLFTRRELLSRMGNGFAALGLTSVMAGEGLLARPAEAATLLNPLAPEVPPLPAKAKRG